MNQPAFTTDPHRIARLTQNYNEGVIREKIPAEQREKMDLELLNVSPSYLTQLFANIKRIKRNKGKPVDDLDV